MMALYQERGVNPAAGCLPLILQMPIWFALFRVLRVGPSDDDPAMLWIPATSFPPDSRLGGGTCWTAIPSFLGMDMLQSPQRS